MILAVAVAQIDPLSVASVMADNRLSDRAKTILGAWSSFDDPVTVILAFYAVSWVKPIQDGLSASYLTDLGLNALFAAVAYAVWRLVRKAPPVMSHLAAGGKVGYLGVRAMRDWCPGVLEAGVGTDFRGGFPPVLLRFSAAIAGLAMRWPSASLRLPIL
ncbi:hypothetical protein ETD86_26755 [Nonomuraea turkmeniaca]|uniref:Uncharacterized protein n=1 Tax=Nonomuraea turkmeniaca TaxID=103838 RepID=A0A5S4FX11_9ACTN|nr:hypothetical protein [Nonomuraea turkmeniaca]TMR15670.1 hypothetical protein ETD86_26755 [Nonomuraea turkmeniaca]